MGMTFIDPVDVTPSGHSADTWTDMDLSAQVAAGATGVILHIQNNTSSDRHLAYRKNGSSDDAAGYRGDIESNSHAWLHIGCDGSQIVEFYHEETAGAAIVWIIGYWDTDATFNTNYTDYTPGSLDTWTDADITADTGGGAIAGIFVLHGPTISGGINLGARKNGSTDDRYLITETWINCVVPVDAGEIAEVQIGFEASVAGLIGWIDAGAQFPNTNLTDVSLGTTGSWIDLATLPSGSTGAIYEISTTGATQSYGIRINGGGEADDLVHRAIKQHGWATAEASALICEGQISDTGVDFFQVGEIGAFGGGGAQFSPLGYTMTRLVA